MDAVRLCCLAVLAAWTLAGGAPSPGALIAVSASVAALVAARERRHRDMAVAAGIAAGVSPVGLALLPVLIGTAIARRALSRYSECLIGAAMVTTLVVGWSPASDASLATVMPHDASALLLATAAGVAAWIGAHCAARSPLPRELDAAALLACLALPLLAPLGPETAGLAVALAIGGAPLRLAPLARAANDDPLPLRPSPL